MRDRVPAGVTRFARARRFRDLAWAAGIARLCGGGAPFAGNAPGKGATASSAAPVMLEASAPG